MAFCLREKFYAAGILDKNKTLVDFAMSNVEKFQKKDFNEKIGEMWNAFFGTRLSSNMDYCVQISIITLPISAGYKENKL